MFKYGFFIAVKVLYHYPVSYRTVHASWYSKESATSSAYILLTLAKILGTLILNTTKYLQSKFVIAGPVLSTILKILYLILI